MTAPPLDSARACDELLVLRGERRVGRLRRTEHGASFRYEPDVVAVEDPASLAVAFRMPVRAEPYDVRGVNLHPFFAGLLPEGLRLRALTREVKTSEDDLFSLLAAAGRHTVGDVRAKRADRDDPDALPLLDVAHTETVSFAELTARAASFGEGGDPVSVPGVQPKVSAVRISLPVRASRGPREYLLKLSPEDLPRLVENEAFWMDVARDAGLAAARVRVVRDRDGVSGLLVERFDRVPAADGSKRSVPVHQEDACQLLDRYPADKYRLRWREVAEALEVCTAPVVERLALLRLLAFSYAVANGDLHGKNVSVRVLDGRTSLTPAYEVLSTLPYGDRKLAIGIEGRDEDLRVKDFVAFGERVGVREAATRRMLARVVRAVGRALPRVEEIGLTERRTADLRRELGRRLEQLDPSAR